MRAGAPANAIGRLSGLMCILTPGVQGWNGETARRSLLAALSGQRMLQVAVPLQLSRTDAVPGGSPGRTPPACRRRGEPVGLAAVAVGCRCVRRTKATRSQ